MSMGAQWLRRGAALWTVRERMGQAALWVLVSSVVAVGCGVSLYTSPAERRAELQAALAEAMEKGDAERVKNVANAYAKFEMSVEERVWLRSELLLLGLQEGKETEIAANLELLAKSIENFVPDRQASALTDSERARRQSELALRNAQAWAFAELLSEQSEFSQGNESRRRLEAKSVALGQEAEQLAQEQQILERVGAVSRASSAVAKAALGVVLSREQASSEQLAQRHAEEMTTLQTRADALSKSIDETKQRIAELEQALASEQAKVDESRSAVETARAQLAETQKAQDERVAQASGVVKEAQNVESEARARLVQVGKERELAVKASDAVLSRLLTALAAVEKSSKAEQLRLETALNKANTGLSEANRRFDQSESQKKQAQTELDESKARFESEVQTLRTQLEGALEETKPTLQKQLAQTEAAQAKKLAALETALGKAEASYASANDAEGKARALMETARLAYEEALRVGQEQVQAAQEAVAAASIEKSRVVGEHDGFVAEAQTVLDSRVRELEEAKTGLATAKQTQLAELSSAKQGVTEGSARLASAEQAQKVVQKSVSDERKTLEKSLAGWAKEQEKLASESAAGQSRRAEEAAAALARLGSATGSFDAAVAAEQASQAKTEAKAAELRGKESQNGSERSKLRSELDLVEEQRGEEARLFLLATNTYLAHHGDAILVAAVLWNQAQFLGLDDQPLAAIEVYKKITGLDFTGEYSSRAFEAIAAAYLQASTLMALPSPPATEPTEVPSPHKEWLATAQQMLKANPGHPEALSIELRMDEIAHAFGHSTQEQRLLRSVELRQKYGQLDADGARLETAQVYFELGKNKDAYAVLEKLSKSGSERAAEAAVLWLEHVAKHGSVNQFRKLRKDIAANKKLWESATLRSKVAELRKQVEGD